MPFGEQHERQVMNRYHPPRPLHRMREHVVRRVVYVEGPDASFDRSADAELALHAKEEKTEPPLAHHADALLGKLGHLPHAKRPGQARVHDNVFVGGLHSRESLDQMVRVLTDPRPGGHERVAVDRDLHAVAVRRRSNSWSGSCTCPILSSMARAASSMPTRSPDRASRRMLTVPLALRARYRIAIATTGPTPNGARSSYSAGT